MTKGIKLAKHPLASLAGAILLIVASSSTQASDLAQVCERAAQSASRATGVPLDVLRAIALTETGRKRNGRFQSWPWTVNMEGVGRWFDTRAEALEYATSHHAQGKRSFDVGCFQINYRWHGKAFASIDAMFDPETNAIYAANFLKELFAEFGDWTIAAGAYHSRTPKYAEKYRDRFARLRKNLSPPSIQVAEPAEPAPPTPAVNSFPLLIRTADTKSLASLVPLRSGGRTRLIDVAGQ